MRLELMVLLIIASTSFIIDILSKSSRTDDEVFQKYSRVFRNKFRVVILLAKARTGSTIIADIIGSIPGIFYNYEPIFLATHHWWKNMTESDKIQYLRTILQCQFSDAHPFKEYRRLTGMAYKTPIFNDLCTDSIKCTDGELEEFDEDLCGIYNIHFMKSIEISMEAVSDAVTSMSSGIIHLVRDPRAILASRVESREYLGKTAKFVNSSVLCSELKEDLMEAEKFRLAKPGRYLRIHYENFALQPTTEVRRILRFIGVTYTKDTEEHIRKHTMGTFRDEKILGTFREARQRAFRWRGKLPFADMKNIQDQCMDVLKKLGYPIYPSIEEYNNSTLEKFL